MSNKKNLELYVKFANEIAKFRFDFRDFIQGLLFVEFGVSLDVGKDIHAPIKMKPLKECELPRAMTIIDFLIALYTSRFCHSDYLDLFLQFVSQEPCENRLKCAGYLLKIIGAKLERERSSTIEESFARIKQNQKSQKYKILFEKIEKLSINKWIFDSEEDEKSYMLAMGADWKKNEEEVQVDEKNSKFETKSSVKARKKVRNKKEKISERANLEELRICAVGDNMDNKEVSSLLKLDQKRSIASTEDQERLSGSNLDQGEPSTSNLHQRGPSTSNMN
ncbi:unnamed protein product [Chironomus riparius]|uniref:Uncharacterized protein n=1 Tax=Chironomus riparius TaxID=315576 RepID=A0A9N9S6X5_9DIPT|nr:unnamed protein product [Chironomus riparius]